MHLDFTQIDNFITLLLKILSAPLVIMFFTKWAEYLKHKKTVQTTTIKNLHETDALLKAGVIALLHNKIYANCTEYLKKGYITTGQKDDLDYLFGGYKDLGGNSTGEWLYNRASELPVKEEG